MHVYIYDSFLSQGKYHSLLARIETRITDLGLNGKVVRLGQIKNIKETVENEIRRGAKTIIAVGDDELVSQIINGVANTNIPLGIIPINTKKNQITNALGISPSEQACDILSARRIEKIDLGVINNSFFISSLVIPNEGTITQINEEYSIEVSESGETSIINLPINKNFAPENFTLTPQDGNLEVVIKTQKAGKLGLGAKEAIQGVISSNNITIINKKHHPVLVDGVYTVNTPTSVNISKNALNIIVGKDRLF